MGGGNGRVGRSNGGMIRSVARAVSRARVSGLHESFSSSSTTTAGASSSSSTTKNKAIQKPYFTNLFSLSSSVPFSSHALPLIGNSNLPNWSHSEEFDWVSVDGSEDGDFERVHHGGVFDEIVLGAVPSLDEVQNAVYALQQGQFVRDMYGVGSEMDVEDHHITFRNDFGSESDWIEPSIQFSNSRMFQPDGSNRVYNAFHLLQTDKSVQRMVVSLSSDKAVWDAVLNNEAVRELKDSLDADEDYSLPSIDENSDESSDATVSIIKRLFDSTKEKTAQLIQTIMKLVNHLFQYPAPGKTGAIYPFDEKLRSTFLLTIVVMLIVIVGRARGA